MSLLKLSKGSGRADDGRATWFAWQRQLSAEDPSDAAKVSAIDAHNRRAHSERPVIDIICPLCGKSFFLEEGERGGENWEAHGVDVDGRVSPSVVCPFKCGLHVYIILTDWNLGELPEVTNK